MSVLGIVSAQEQMEAKGGDIHFCPGALRHTLEQEAERPSGVYGRKAKGTGVWKRGITGASLGSVW